MEIQQYYQQYSVHLTTDLPTANSNTYVDHTSFDDGFNFKSEAIIYLIEIHHRLLLFLSKQFLVLFIRSLFSILDHENRAISSLDSSEPVFLADETATQIISIDL